MKRLSALLSLSLLVLVAGCASSPKPVNFEGMRLPEIGSDVDPSQQLENLSFDTLQVRAAEHAAQGNFDLAILHYNQALARDPESVSALMGLGELFWKQRNLDAARKVYARILDLDAHHVGALVGVGRTLRGLGALEQSQTFLARAVEVAPEHPEALTELAIVYDHRGRYAQAEPIYRRVVAMAPGQPGPLNNLGFNLLLQKRYDEAITPLRQALAQMPLGIHIKNNLAAAYLLTGREAHGMELFSDSVGKAGAWNNLGYIHLTQGNWEDAEHAFNKALEVNPVYYPRAKQNLQRVKELRALQAP